MFMRTWINIIFLLAAAYGSYRVIAGKFYIASTWQYYFYLLSPWVLLIGSIKAWHRSFTWRRMMAAKDISPELSRGLHQSSKLKQHPSILEHACLSLFLMSVVAIFKQIGIADTPWWIGSILGSYFMLRLTIGMIK